MDSEQPLLSTGSFPAEDEGQFGNAYFRWTVFYGLVIFLLTLMPIWLSILVPNLIARINAIVILLFSAIWLCIGINAWRNFNLLHTVSIPPLSALQAAKTRNFVHVVVVPCYLDPLDVLFDCLGSLLMQNDPSNLLVVVAFEAKTPDLLMKENAVKTAFSNKFGHFIITIHTVDRNREIAGGCSNKNYALRQAHQYLQRIPKLLMTHAVTVTTCDTDSLFHPLYFSTLETVYNTENSSLTAAPRMCVWQPPLFYNWDLDKRPFFNRITGIMRSMMMLGGLISFNLNPMSIFSYPLELGLKAGFINPRYGVDDIIAKVRWMCSTNEAVPVLLLPIPSISGPTIGTSFYNEYEEWSRQIRRWIVGSSESFHFFIIHWRGEPFFAGVWWFFMFFMYYAVLLCSAGIFTLLAGIPLPWVEYQTYAVGSLSISLKDMSLIGLLIQYFVFGIAFIIDRKAVKMLTVKEDISLARNVLHWLLAPPTLLLYSFIAFYAIVSFMWNGKKMARHDMAAKDGLVASTAVEWLRASDNVPAAAAGHRDGNTGSNSVPQAPRRSTSLSRDATQGASQSSAKLPSRFYFGAYSVAVADLKQITSHEEEI